MSDSDDLKTPLEQFAYDLHQEVLAKCNDDLEPQLREEAFTEVVLELLTEHNETDSADICYFSARNVGRTPAAKLNAWSLSGDGAALDVFVTYYVGEGKTEAVTKAEMEAYYRLARGFLRRSLDGFHTQVEEANPIFDALRRIHEVRGSLTTIRLFFLTDGVVKSAEIDQEQMVGYELRYVFWDLTKLSRLRVGERQVIELDFVRDYDGAVPALLTADATGEYRTFLAFLSAPTLARIYGEHGQRLLERNVRAFLGKGKSVNKGIQKTLRDEPHRFLAYNNGLCCTAAEVNMEPGKDGHVRMKSVRDFQIVNGGQTTASIYHALKVGKVDVSRVMVQMKLTVLTDPAGVAEIVPLISQYANSQNKVSGADLGANGAYHHQLQQLSRSMWAPPRSGLERGTQWYYERARGSYLDDKLRQSPSQTASAKTRQWMAERPVEQKFTKTDLAKFEHAWECLPHIVCKGNEKNFKEFAERQEEHGAPMVNEQYFQNLIGKAILWKTCERLYSSLELIGLRSSSVPYAISWLVARSNARIDLKRIWQDQRLPPGLYDAMSVVLMAADKHIRLSPHHPIKPEAAKKEECWKEFRGKTIPLALTWESEWADKPIITPRQESDLFPQEWERLRQSFLNDSRTIQGLETYTGRTWVTKCRRDTVASFAAMTWDELTLVPEVGRKKARILLEMFAAASR
ncbi:MAG: AIPR family protein [Verrucomicrobia bacterium]|nr:AIPR family protein [Verrucomicrobiota bacterium]